MQNRLPAAPSGARPLRALVRSAAIAAIAAIAVAAPGADAHAKGKRAPLVGFNEQMLVGVDGLSPEEKLELADAAGASTVRISLDWRPLEPYPDYWHEPAWESAREVYADARARGMRPILTLVAAPWWARAGDCGGNWACVAPPAPEMDEEWAEFAAEVADRFPGAVLEIWNEPNLRSYWWPEPDPKRYAELLDVAYRAIKDANPKAPVLGASVSGTQETQPGAQVAMPAFLRATYRARPRVAKRMDGLSFHIYGLAGGLGRRGTYRKVLRQATRISRRFAGRTPLWVTEVGVSTGAPENVSERRQRDLLWRAWRSLSKRRAVRAVVFHRLVEPRESVSDEWEWGTGWVRYAPERAGEAPPVRPVFCLFAKRLGRGYPGCPG
jgi:hypothetical protein